MGAPSILTHEPVSTFADALRWLVVNASPEEWIWAEDAEIPDVAVLICDMFWCQPSDLCRALRKLYDPPRKAALPPRRNRRSYFRGAR